MLKTEAEARQCWCPMSRCIQGTFDDRGATTARLGQASFNVLKGRALEQSNHGSCIGSACMMWRWGESLEEREVSYVERAEASTHIEEMKKKGWSGGATFQKRNMSEIHFSRVRADRRGFCGLAGDGTNV